MPDANIEAMPWGGRLETRRTWESRMAEFFRAQLKKYAGKDPVIAVPMRFQQSNYRPYGDGQTNAFADMGSSWTHREPLVYTVRYGTGLQQRTDIVFHRSLGVVSYDRKEKDGWLFIQPRNWQDGFAFRFDAQMMRVDEFLKGIPARLRTFSRNRAGSR